METRRPGHLCSGRGRTSTGGRRRGARDALAPSDADGPLTGRASVTPGDGGRHCHLPRRTNARLESCHQRHGRPGRDARAESDVINHRHLLQFPKINRTGRNYSAGGDSHLRKPRRARTALRKRLSPSGPGRPEPATWGRKHRPLLHQPRSGRSSGGVRHRGHPPAAPISQGGGTAPATRAGGGDECPGYRPRCPDGQGCRSVPVALRPGRPAPAPVRPWGRTDPGGPGRQAHLATSPRAGGATGRGRACGSRSRVKTGEPTSGVSEWVPGSQGTGASDSLQVAPPRAGARAQPVTVPSRSDSAARRVTPHGDSRPTRTPSR